MFIRHNLSHVEFQTFRMDQNYPPLWSSPQFKIMSVSQQHQQQHKRYPQMNNINIVNNYYGQSNDNSLK